MSKPSKEHPAEPPISDESLDELLAGDGLRQNLTQRLALDLRAARQESARRGKVILTARGLLVEFINKHDVPTTAKDLIAIYDDTSAKTFGLLDGNNLHTPLIWLQNVLDWATNRTRGDKLDT